VPEFRGGHYLGISVLVLGGEYSCIDVGIVPAADENFWGRASRELVYFDCLREKRGMFVTVIFATGFTDFRSHSLGWNGKYLWIVVFYL